MVEMRQPEERFAREHLEPATGVRSAVAQQATADAVRDPRGQSPQPRVPPLRAPARQHLQVVLRSRCREALEQRRDVGRVVLAVAVQRRDPRVPRVPDAGRDRRALAAASRVTDEPQRRDPVAQSRELGGRGVVAAVVDVDDLVGAEACERGDDLRHQRLDVLRLVADGDDDRQAAVVGNCRHAGALERPAGARAPTAIRRVCDTDLKPALTARERAATRSKAGSRTGRGTVRRRLRPDARSAGSPAGRRGRASRAAGVTPPRACSRGPSRR